MILKRAFCRLVKEEAGKFTLTQFGRPISFWKDVPLALQGTTLNAVIEIPESRLAKLQMDKKDPFHSIRQCTIKSRFSGKEQPRYYAKFPAFSYGFLPQTWQDPFLKQEGMAADDDPLDVLQVGRASSFSPGQVVRVQLIGGFCLIDQDQVDWKLLVLNQEQAKRRGVRSLADFVKQQPWRLQLLKEWFLDIKQYDGKKPNSIHYQGKVFDEQETLQIVTKYNVRFKSLLAESSPSPAVAQRLRSYHLKTG